MRETIDPTDNFEKTRLETGYLSRLEATPKTYSELGFKCGLEIHQQLKTEKKLFCRCPAGLYQDGDDFDAEVIRHMRPTLSELGEYDGTALMEFKTKKNIIYRIKDESACTYDIDDTPPFAINREALDQAIEIALLLKTNIVGELHITRKQYLDGSIPTGFQRTAIVGIEGEIPLRSKKVRIIQLNIEEDACREVSDTGHWRIYTTDRLGMPLIEIITYPDLLTPDEAAEAGQYLRYLVRSTDKGRTGIGAGREDVNVSITGGDRVEIKGVAHIKWIPELVHNEAFRQRALLLIRDELKRRITDTDNWRIGQLELTQNIISAEYEFVRRARANNYLIKAINLPKFAGILSFFTQPGQSFADELSGRIKVIACLEQPNMTHSEMLTSDGYYSATPLVKADDWRNLKRNMKAGPEDAQIIIWGLPEDIKTAVETLEERCRMAFDGVPNETRKGLPDGTTIFERVLPGPDRMYPDTDSAPLPVEDEQIEQIRQRLPQDVEVRLKQLNDWDIPKDTHGYLLRNNLVWLIQKIVEDFNQPPKFVGTLMGHTLRHIETHVKPAARFEYYTIYGLFKFISARKLERTIVKEMLPVLYGHPKMVFDSVLTAIGYRKLSNTEITGHIEILRNKFGEIKKSDVPCAETNWIMGRLRRMALGNMPLSELKKIVEEGNRHE